MFKNVKIGDTVKIYFPPLYFQKKPAGVEAIVVEVKASTFVVKYLVDVYRQGEFRKRDGKSTHNNDDYGWIEEN